MGVKVERRTVGSERSTVTDNYPEGTSFYYSETDKILYIQVDGVTEGPGTWLTTGEAFIAAYPKGNFIRAWLDPVPDHETGTKTEKEEK